MAELNIIDISAAQDPGDRALAIVRELRIELDQTKARVLELVSQREVDRQVHTSLVKDLERQLKSARAIAGRAAAAAERIEDAASKLRSAVRDSR